MLVFGVNLPLVELFLLISVIMLILLAEAIVFVSLLIKQMNTNRKLGKLLEDLTNNLLQVGRRKIDSAKKR
jgi:hypothetical protein